MPDGDDTTPPPARPRKAHGWFFVGFFAALVVGVVLGFVVFRANGPGWAMPVAFFAPVVLFFVVASALFFPRVVREMREAARNAPSPESVAAAAGGEGVEVGTRAAPAADPDDTPTVPVLLMKPGAVFPHRLNRADMSAGCQFGCAVFAAVFWNGIVSVFVYQLVRRWNRGGVFRWFEAAFLVPFALIGVAMVAFVLFSAFRLFVSVLVGRVEVELDAHPLTPGGKGRVHIAQRGLFPLARVRVWLVCTEEASYMAGTSKSTAKEEVARHGVTDPDDETQAEVARHPVADPDMHPGGGRLPLEEDFTVPAGAMHSFEAPNNAIKWTLAVSGRVLGLPFSDTYAIVVAPLQGAGVRRQAAGDEETDRSF